jgi:hypothetical protein
MEFLLLFHFISMLFYTVRRVIYFLICYNTPFQDPILSDTGVALTSFVHPPCWYYRLKATKKHMFGVASNGIMSIPNLIKICEVVLELKHEQMDR